MKDERHPAHNEISNTVPFEQLEDILEISDRIHPLPVALRGLTPRRFNPLDISVNGYQCREAL
jgi:hypothetical protein